MELPLYRPKAVHYRFVVPQRRKPFWVCRDVDLDLAQFIQYVRSCYTSNEEGAVFCQLPLAVATTTKRLVHVLGKLTRDAIPDLVNNQERAAILCLRVCEMTVDTKLDAQSLAYTFVSSPK